MKSIFIDFTGGVLGQQHVKFHGGGSFARWLISELKNQAEFGKAFQLTVLWPKSQQANTKEEIGLFHEIKILQTNNITEVEYPSNAILILPLVPNVKFSLHKKLKTKFPQLRIYAVVHGVRNIDLQKFDAYDKYYTQGVYRSLFFVLNRLIKFAKAAVEKYNLRFNLIQVDKVFTVSNYSMQRILEYGKVQSIKFIYQKTLLVDEEIKVPVNDKFVLFVAANKAEKNFVRTLKAFQIFKEQSPADHLYLYVTGLTEERKKELSKLTLFNEKIINKWVKALNYVDSDYLSDLYKQCYFLLYTSKSEGYGIPPLEACLSGVPTVATNVTSVPEVLGAAALYVNPYDEYDIANGIKEMSKSRVRNFYQQKVQLLAPLLKQRQELDAEILMNEILS